MIRVFCLGAEKIIGDYKGYDDENHKLDNPRSLSAEKDEQGSITWQVEALWGEPKTMVITKQSVSYSYDVPDPALVDVYTKDVTSVVVVKGGK